MPEDYVSPGAHYGAQASEMSGAPPVAGMPPYPLYGLPTLGEEVEAAVPFYKTPIFCYAVGGVVGFGLGYLVFGILKPRMKPNPKKRRTTRNKKAPSDEAALDEAN
jgi:hypothetical protein